MARAWTNFAKSTLATGIAPAATSVTVAVGDGALFPTAGAGTTFDVVIYNTSGMREVCSCTSRTGDVLTITRAQEGTTALTWNAADRIGHRLTAAALNSILFAANMQQNTPTWCGTAGGTTNALALAPSPAVTAMVAGHRFIFKVGAATNTTAVTFSVSGLATFAGQNNGAALVAGDLEASKWYEVLYDGIAGQIKKFSLGIQSGLLTATGDMVYASAASTPARLPLGTALQQLRVNAGATAPEWFTSSANAAPGSRQTQLYGTLDSSGYNNTISAGAALNFNVSATATNTVTAYAQGNTDSITTLTADLTNQGSLAASNTNFIYSDYVSSSSETFSSGLVPPQEGYAFDRTKNAICNFEGTNGATTTTDDFGNTVTLTGATISTTRSKFGSSSLSLSGTAQNANITTIKSLGSGSFEFGCWFYTTSLAALEMILAAESTAGFGLKVSVQAAGTLRFDASSAGAGNDIFSSITGSTVCVINTWYRVRVVFDALGGTYKLYLSNNGAAETLECNQSFTTRICAINNFYLGHSAQAGFNDFTGNIDAFWFWQAATNTSTVTPSASAPAITDQKVHFFSIPAMTMYEVTAASASAGTNPTLTARTRVKRAECDTNGSTVTAVRNYALRGQWQGVWTNPLPGLFTNLSQSHNIGVTPVNYELEIENVTAEFGYSPGIRVKTVRTNDGGSVQPINPRVTPLTIGASVSGTSAFNILTISGSPAGAAITAANWKYRFTASRGW